MDYITIGISVLCSIVITFLISAYTTRRENRKRRETQFLINRITLS